MWWFVGLFGQFRSVLRVIQLAFNMKWATSDIGRPTANTWSITIQLSNTFQEARPGQTNVHSMNAEEKLLFFCMQKEIQLEQTTYLLLISSKR